MTSRPLFISVAESIVIFPPISHVGWRSASSTVTDSSSARRAPAERAARGGQDEPVDGARRLPGDQLVQGRVLGVDRQDARAGRLGELHDELAADDERLLVGERQVDPLAERRRPSGRGPAEPTSALSTRSAPDPVISSTSPSGADEHLAVVGVRPRAPRRRGRRARSAATPSARRLRDERLPRARRAEPDDLEVRRARDDVERLHADRAGGAEDEQAAGHGAAVCRTRPRPAPRGVRWRACSTSSSPRSTPCA